MLNLINFYSPEEGGAGGTAQSVSDDLFEFDNNSDAGSDQQPIDGMTAVNIPDSEGKPLKPNAQNDDDSVAEDFDTLIKGRYKDDFQKKVEGLINKRFKNVKQNEEKLQKYENERAMLQPLFDAMASKYGIDSKDIKAIVDAADKDNSNFEKEAFEKGFGDAAEYRKYLAREQELNRLRESERVRNEAEKQDHQRRQLLEGWIEESKEFQKEVPDFNFKNEWDGSERFRYLVNSGFKVKEAYMAIHAEEYARASAEKAQQQILREIRANKSRPTESTVNAQASIRVKKSIKDMSLEDTERIIREAKSGKKITF